jgi:hypothetical protein
MDKLQPLEELEIKDRTCAFDRVYCHVLYLCMNWIKLIRLGLDLRVPRHLLRPSLAMSHGSESLDFSHHSKMLMPYSRIDQIPLKECPSFLSALSSSQVQRCEFINDFRRTERSKFLIYERSQPSQQPRSVIRS